MLEMITADFEKEKQRKVEHLELLYIRITDLAEMQVNFALLGDIEAAAKRLEDLLDSEPELLRIKELNKAIDLYSDLYNKLLDNL